MFSLRDLRFLLCSRDLDVLRAQRIICFIVLITHNSMRSENPIMERNMQTTMLCNIGYETDLCLKMEVFLCTTGYLPCDDMSRGCKTSCKTKIDHNRLIIIKKSKLAQADGSDFWSKLNYQYIIHNT